MLRFEEYLNAVAEQIRVKRIRGPLMQELRDHMECQMDAYLEEGLSEAEAQTRTIADMGDALLVGGELDLAHRPQIQWKGIFLALFFIALGTIFQLLFSPSDLINGKYLAFSVTAAGILLLVSNVDYTFWMKLVFPTLTFWLLLWAMRFYNMATPLITTIRFPALYNLTAPLRFGLYLIIPECICVAAPLLTAFLACRFRSRKWGAFAFCTAIPILTAILAKVYWQTGYNSNAMMLMSLCAFGVLFIAVHSGFFQVRHSAAYSVLGILCAIPICLFSSRLIRFLSLEAEYMSEIYRLLLASRPVGPGAPVEITYPWILEYPGSVEMLLPLIIHRLGWIPFALFTVAMFGLLTWLFIRFIRMKNRMGALLGIASTLTLCAQCAVYYLYSFTSYPHLLGLPLVSYGNAMLIIDAIVIGIILSSLRGQVLPEPVPLHPAST